VDWVLETRRATARPAALAQLQALVDGGLVHHVRDGRDMGDRPHWYYRFRADDAAKAVKVAGPPAQAVLPGAAMQGWIAVRPRTGTVGGRTVGLAPRTRWYCVLARQAGEAHVLYCYHAPADPQPAKFVNFEVRDGAARPPARLPARMPANTSRTFPFRTHHPHFPAPPAPPARRCACRAVSCSSPD